MLLQMLLQMLLRMIQWCKISRWKSSSCKVTAWKVATQKGAAGKGAPRKETAVVKSKNWKITVESSSGKCKSRK